MATLFHAARVDEVTVTREAPLTRARTFLPHLSADRESTLGRVFGFAELKLPRTPQIDELLVGIEHELGGIYGNGSLRPDETPELFFENAIRRVEDGIVAYAHERRIKIDPSAVNLFFASIHDGTVYMAATGTVFAYLIRRVTGKPARVVDIFRGLSADTPTEPKGAKATPPTQRLLGNMVVGSIAPSDIILFANAALTDAVPVADLVRTTEQIDQAGIAAHLRALILTAKPTGPAIGLILRLAPVRHLMAGAENQSVKHLLSREEEVARVLRPAGMPEIGSLLSRIRGSRHTNSAPAETKTPKLKQSILERFNALPRQGKIALLLLLTLLALFLISLKIAGVQKQNTERHRAYTAVVTDIKRHMDDAEGIVIYDEPRAGALIAQARTLFNQLPKNSKQEKATAESLGRTLVTLEHRLAHLFEVTPRVVATIEAPGSIIAGEGGTFITNAGANLVRITNGTASTVGTLTDTPVWATNDGDTLYVWLKNNTLISVEVGEGIPKALGYEGPSAPRDGGLWNGSLYVITSEGRQIYKLPPTLTGFGRGGTWFKNELTGDGVRTLALDGTIFAAVPHDAVRQWSRGTLTSFTASAGTANDAPKQIRLTTKEVYLLGEDGTISAWDKDGKLLGQYIVGGDHGHITAFTVDEKTKAITAITDKGVVLQFDLMK